MKIIEKFYQTLEEKNNFSCLTSNFIKDMSDVDIFIRDMERCAFFENIEIIKNLEYYIKMDRQYSIDYYKSRFNETQNPILKARYSYVLSKLTPSKEWVDNAQKYLMMSLEELNSNLNKPLDVLKPIKDLVDLAVHDKSIEYINIERFIYNVFTVSDFETQAEIISCETRIFRSRDIIVHVLQKCKKILEKLDIYHRINLCEAAIYYSTKIQDENLKKYFLEKAGDTQLEIMQLRKGDAFINEHYLKKALDYYLQTNNQIKKDKTQRQYDTNKHNIRLCPFSQEVTLNTEFLKPYFDMTSSELFKYIIYGLPEQIGNNQSSDYGFDQLYNNFYRMGIQLVNFDVNHNSRSILTQDDLESEVHRTEVNFKFQFAMLWMHEILVVAIANGKLNFKDFYRYLCHNTIFGKIVTEGVDKDYQYRPIDKFDFAIQDFFKLLKAATKNTNVDWRRTIICMTTAFEGVLRDIMIINEAKTGHLKNNMIKEMLLDKMLKQPFVKEYYGEENLQLFEYIMTHEGLNIRNNIAHSFYSPRNYTMETAILVFMSLMRLASSPKNIDVSSNNKED